MNDQNVRSRPVIKSVPSSFLLLFSKQRLRKQDLNLYERLILPNDQGNDVKVCFTNVPRWSVPYG